MEIKPQGQQRGSFGIPPEMREAAEKHRLTTQARKEQEEGKSSGRPVEPVIEDMGLDKAQLDFKSDANDLEAATENAVKKELDPEIMLKRIGIEITDDDFYKLVFRGSLEKEITIVKHPRDNDKNLTAHIKTLTAEEFDEVDEAMSTEIKSTQMTNEGYEVRRNTWILSYAVTKLMGKPIVKDVLLKDGKTLDRRATVLLRRAVLQRLAPQVINKLVVVYSTLATALSILVNDPQSEAIKKS